MSGPLDLDARYRVRGFGGVAFYVVGTVQESREVVVQVCDDDHEHDEACWSVDVETYDSDTLVRAVMVGDDREHIVDRDDLTAVSDDDYCHECGQIGCTADGRVRDEADDALTSVRGEQEEER